MEVLLAEHAGACYGVKRALELAKDAAQLPGTVQTLGPLIHNPLVVQDLQEKGVGIAKSPEEACADHIVIRSHGVTPETFDVLAQSKRDIIDATCPHVLRAQQAAFALSEAGKTVVIVGEPNHPEVHGLQAWALRGKSPVYIVSSAHDLPATLKEPIGIVVQTTQSRERLQHVLDVLDARGLSYELHDTICSSTSKRQTAAEKLAQNVDAMVVVGGKNSSNTTRLAEICRKHTPKVFHIESATELDKRDFIGVACVGVCAGASTPDSQIQAAVDCLRLW